MAVLPSHNYPSLLSSAEQNAAVAVYEKNRRKQIVILVLLVIVAFQAIDLLGAILSQSMTDVWTAFVGFALCGIALLFQRSGQIAVVSVLLILVVDLGCGVMLLFSPMGLDASSLPVFDVLLLSELIAVSLLPAISVFPVALLNILFIGGVLAFQPRTPGMEMMLMSNMAFPMVAQPITLQIVIAVVSYLWVRSALNAIARADRAEEIAALQQREAELLEREMERKHELDRGVEHLTLVLVAAANGQESARAQLTPDNALWGVGNTLNLMLTRLRRSIQTEREVNRLRAEVFRLSQALYHQGTPLSQPSRQGPPSSEPLRRGPPSSEPLRRGLPPPRPLQHPSR